ncbi:MAG: hypothetical protein OIF36_00290 [Alphaproteobacteria bacterium]|nr:hypothetical protein [Alphaproteobacteria bacterium]
MKDRKIEVFDVLEQSSKWKVDFKDALSARDVDFWHKSLRIILMFKNCKEPTFLIQKNSYYSFKSKGKFDFFSTCYYEHHSARSLIKEMLVKRVGIYDKELSNIVNGGKSFEIGLFIKGQRCLREKSIYYTLWAEFDREISELKWDKNEVNSIWKITISDFWRIIDGFEVDIKGFNGKKQVIQKVSICDFAVKTGKFYEKILIMSERYFYKERIAV